MIPVVCIDGPSGAGKGTIARLVAEKTGFSLLDSGALYRITALASLNKGIDLAAADQVADVAQQLVLRFEVEAGRTKIMLDDADVSQSIRSEEIGLAASKVAAYPQVRLALLQCQRDFCQAPGLVADGRDMGTVVFPDAAVKVFLTASAEERARRRVLQIEHSGGSCNYQQVLEDIQSRDERDSSRSSAPLVAAGDALILDSTSMSIDEVINQVMQEIKKKIHHV